MRAIDWNLSIAVVNHWNGKLNPSVKLCPLLADLDRLLQYLEATRLKPGHAIDKCPQCGEEHRWTLLKELLIHALDLRPAHQHPLLESVDRSLDSVRKLYGGDAGYKAMKKGAEEYFAKLGANNNDTL